MFFKNGPVPPGKKKIRERAADSVMFSACTVYWYCYESRPYVTDVHLMLGLVQGARAIMLPISRCLQACKQLSIANLLYQNLQDTTRNVVTLSPTVSVACRGFQKNGPIVGTGTGSIAQYTTDSTEEKLNCTTRKTIHEHDDVKLPDYNTSINVHQHNLKRPPSKKKWDGLNDLQERTKVIKEAFFSNIIDFSPFRERLVTLKLITYKLCHKETKQTT